MPEYTALARQRLRAVSLLFASRVPFGVNKLSVRFRAFSHRPPNRRRSRLRAASARRKRTKAVRSGVSSSSAKPQKRLQASAIIERLGEPLVGEVVPDREQQRAEQRQRRPRLRLSGLHRCRPTALRSAPMQSPLAAHRVRPSGAAGRKSGSPARCCGAPWNASGTRKPQGITTSVRGQPHPRTGLINHLRRAPRARSAIAAIVAGAAASRKMLVAVQPACSSNPATVGPTIEPNLPIPSAQPMPVARIDTG